MNTAYHVSEELFLMHTTPFMGLVHYCTDCFTVIGGSARAKVEGLTESLFAPSGDGDAFGSGVVDVVVVLPKISSVAFKL